MDILYRPAVVIATTISSLQESPSGTANSMLNYMATRISDSYGVGAGAGEVDEFS